MSLYFSLIVSASQDAGGHAIYRQKKNTKCIWVAIPVEAIFHWYDCGADGRAYGHVTTSLPKLLGWIENQIFLAVGFHLLCPNYCQRASQAKTVSLRGGQLNATRSIAAGREILDRAVKSVM